MQCFTSLVKEHTTDQLEKKYGCTVGDLNKHAVCRQKKSAVVAIECCNTTDYCNEKLQPVLVKEKIPDGT